MREVTNGAIPLLEDGEMIKKWDYHEFLPLTKEQEGIAWEKLQQTPDWWLNFPTVLDPDGWDYFLANLYYRRSENLECYFITSRAMTEGDSVFYQSLQWLKKHGAYDPQVIVSSKKGLIAEALDLNYFIDDNLQNCLSIKDHAEDCTVFMVDYPYNRGIVSSSLIISVKNLRQFTDAVLEKEFGNEQ